MAEGFIQITEGAGKKLHSFDRAIGANTVHDEVTVHGEQYLATYSVIAANVSIASAGGIVSINAGSSLILRVRRIRIFQYALASSAATMNISVYRITNAASGGTSVTPRQFDSTDSASGATSMYGTLTATLGNALVKGQLAMVAAQPAAATSFLWEQHPNHKPIIIPAGTSNGIIVYNESGIAGATVDVEITFDESNF